MSSNPSIERGWKGPLTSNVGPVNEREVSLRLAGAADLPCLSALATQVFLETYATSGIRLALAREVEAQFSIRALGKRLGEARCRIILAELSGHLIAFAEVVMGAQHALLPPVPAAELTRLYVQSPFLRRGVGRHLLRRAEELATAEGLSTLWLTAWAGNKRALGFYASQGYEQLGRTEHVFEDESVENRLFAKPLSKPEV